MKKTTILLPLLSLLLLAYYDFGGKERPYAYKQVEAIIRSMTPEERQNPSLIRHARRARAPRGRRCRPGPR